MDKIKIENYYDWNTDVNQKVNNIIEKLDEIVDWINDFEQREGVKCG